MKKHVSVVVKMPRGEPRTGTFVAEHITNNGRWCEIKPHEKGAATFRCRPASVTAA